MRIAAAAVAAAIAVPGLGVPPVHAVNEGTATFVAAWTFVPAVPLVTPGASFLAMATTTCLNVGVHVLEPKAVADAGNCTLTFGGPYVGSCVLGSSAAAGLYTDSAAQVHPLVASVVVSGHVWTMTGAITKGPLTGTIEGGGRWAPAPAGAGCGAAISDGVVNYTV